MRKLLFGVIIILVTGVRPLLAGELTLQAALRAAVTHRPSVQSARAQADAAAAAVDEARSGWLPHLTVSERYSRTDEPAGSLFLALNQERNVMVDPAHNLVDPDDKDDFETRLQLHQTFYDPNIDYGLRRARTAGAAAAAMAAWSAEEAGFAAFRAYLDVQRTMAALAWAESSLQEAAEIARLTAERREAGTGLKADELRASVQLAEARRRSLSARNDLTLARRRLALAVGRPGGEEGIVAPLDEAALPPAPELSVDQRADLRALTLLTEEKTLQVSSTQADWLPRVALSASYAWHDEAHPFSGEAEAWAIGAGLNWELFDGLRRSAATARAMADQRAAAASLDEARREYAFQLSEAQLRAEEALLHQESARQAVLEATESLRLLQQRYAAGLSELADLLTAQSALDRARLDTVGAETRRLVSLGNLHYQAGRFLQAFLPGEEPPR